MSLCDYVHAWSIEWPRACAYWSWNQTIRFLQSRPCMLHDVLVDGCSLGMRGRDGGLIYKRWRVITTMESVARSLSVFRCPGDGHPHSANFDLKNTQHYPEKLTNAFLHALNA